MDKTRVNNRIFYGHWTNQDPKCKTDASCRIKTLFGQQSMSHLFNPIYVFNVKSILDDLQVVLSEHYEVHWYAKLTWVADRNGQGKIFVHTYRLFKNDFLTKAYLKSIMNFKQKSVIVKLRSGEAPTRLETGHYEHLNEDVIERICPI